MTCHPLVGTALLLTIICSSCRETHSDHQFSIADNSLQIELVSESPEVRTPIGIAVNEHDQLLVLESHTHTPARDYAGPKYDRILRSSSTVGSANNLDWTLYADSIEDGMNLHYDLGYGLFVATKDEVLLFDNKVGDGLKHSRRSLVKMTPNNVYDHAGILGVCLLDGWLYISRGNTGSAAWIARGTDDSTVDGYGDGGSVMRCRPDGTDLESIATGFWNPFGLEASLKGRLLLTDNDPDSRGPNRLIDVVHGGNYGYQSLYGGSGLHPFLAWNGELPGTLPYAAPLGEAPCGLIDLSKTNFGPAYSNSVLAAIWEERNLVVIDLSPRGVSVAGAPEVLMQGDSNFRPVAFATNSRGDLFLTDWMLRQYPNHGQGRIWKISGPGTPEVQMAQKSLLIDPSMTNAEAHQSLLSKDVAKSALARFVLKEEKLSNWLDGKNPDLQLQSILIALENKRTISQASLVRLLNSKSSRTQQAALIYIGTMRLTSMQDHLEALLRAGNFHISLTETLLATIGSIQPSFVTAYERKSEDKANRLVRKLPENFLLPFLKSDQMDAKIKSALIPWLEYNPQSIEMVAGLLTEGSSYDVKIAATHYLANVDSTEVSDLLLKVLQEATEVRLQIGCLLSLQSHSKKYCKEVQDLTSSKDELLLRALSEYLRSCGQLPAKIRKANLTEYQRITDGNPAMGEIIFRTRRYQCMTCHRIQGMGSIFGPDLSQVGASKTKQQLIKSVLEPSAEIAPEWQAWYIVDSAGQRHLGRQIDVKADGAKLMNQDGEFDYFRGVKDFGVADISLMPAGLHRTMSVQDFSDLIAYMESLR